MERPVKAEKVAAFLEKILVFPCAQGTPGLYRQAVRLAHRYGVHPYDAAILAAAHETGRAHRLFRGPEPRAGYDGVKVINPFR